MRYPVLSHAALEVVEKFACEELGMESLELKVLESNVHAIDFYLDNGYEAIDRIGLTNSASGTEAHLSRIRRKCL